jgi:hypothetical protein
MSPRFRQEVLTGLHEMVDYKKRRRDRECQSLRQRRSHIRKEYALIEFFNEVRPNHYIVCLTPG